MVNRKSEISIILNIRCSSKTGLGGSRCLIKLKDPNYINYKKRCYS